MDDNLSPLQWSTIDIALQAGRMIEAIRLYREATRCGLAAAKQALQARLANTSISTNSPLNSGAVDPPDQVRAYLTSGYCRSGDLWAWWRTLSGDYCVLVLYQTTPDMRFELGVFPEIVGSWGQQLNGFTLSVAELLHAVATGTSLPGADWTQFPDVQDVIRTRIAALPSPPTRFEPIRGYLKTARTCVYSLNAGIFERDWLHLGTIIRSSQWHALREDIGRNPGASELLEELEPSAINIANEFVELTPASAPLLWGGCQVACNVAAVAGQTQDFYFADLAAERFVSPLPRDLEMAFTLWQRVVDVQASYRNSLPWWLSAAASASNCAIGLLAPSDVRLLSRTRPMLEPWLIGAQRPGDTPMLFDLVDLAANNGDWLVGTEPGT